MILEHLEGFLPFADTIDLELPFGGDIAAGSPMAVADYIEDAIDLNKELITEPGATFIGKVKGLSLKNEGITEDDILIVDTSLMPRDGQLVICKHNGQYYVKRITEENRKTYVICESPRLELSCISEDKTYTVWGVVTYIIKKII